MSDIADQDLMFRLATIAEATPDNQKFMDTTYIYMLYDII